ncbi:hypothetical protein NQ317_019116 [Molorchus minor]|uniref:Uncharacterized protein n=1 Tax=Molorchus minor TaxID=1323400 RepID=A0ABQ9J0W8_9CUCU|nr:hypothetical protein NQ317_019116 [Molorchus minor]
MESEGMVKVQKKKGRNTTNMTRHKYWISVIDVIGIHKRRYTNRYLDRYLRRTNSNAQYNHVCYFGTKSDKDEECEDTLRTFVELRCKQIENDFITFIFKFLKI